MNFLHRPNKFSKTYATRESHRFDKSIRRIYQTIAGLIHGAVWTGEIGLPWTSRSNSEVVRQFPMTRFHLSALSLAITYVFMILGSIPSVSDLSHARSASWCIIISLVMYASRRILLCNLELISGTHHRIKIITSATIFWKIHEYIVI